MTAAIGWGFWLALAGLAPNVNLKQENVDFNSDELSGSKILLSSLLLASNVPVHPSLYHGCQSCYLYYSSHAHSKWRIKLFLFRTGIALWLKRGKRHLVCNVFVCFSYLCKSEQSICSAVFPRLPLQVVETFWCYPSIVWEILGNFWESKPVKKREPGGVYTSLLSLETASSGKCDAISGLLIPFLEGQAGKHGKLWIFNRLSILWLSPSHDLYAEYCNCLFSIGL